MKPELVAFVAKYPDFRCHGNIGRFRTCNFLIASLTNKYFITKKVTDDKSLTQGGCFKATALL